MTSSAPSPAAGPRGAGEELLIAAWFGLASGYLDVAATQGRRLLVEPIAFVGPHQVWTAPLVDLVLFLMMGAGFVLLSRVVRHPAVGRVSVVAYGSLGVLGGLYLFPQVHRLAAVLLALGIGVQLARAAARNEAAFRRLVRRSLPWLAATTAVVAVGMVAWQHRQERRVLASLPAARAGAPNVLLLVLDTVRAMNLSLYGYPRPTTPRLAAFAAAGVTFDRALSVAPWTLPSHASMMTGRHAHELSADWMVPLDERYPTLAEALGRAGYRSAGFVANTDYCSREVGLARGFSHYEDYTLTPGLMARSSALGRAIARVQLLRRLIGNHDNLGRKDAAEINEAFLGWLDRGESAPFFAFLNYYDAHRPYFPPDSIAARFRTAGVAPNPRQRKEDGSEVSAPPERIQGAIDSYDGAIAALDQELGELFEALRSRGQLDNTIVIVTSDHGEEFMEHGVWDHGNTLYLPALHVPLVLVWLAGVPAERRVAAPVSLRDLAATVLDLTGEEGAGFPGHTLARHWRGESSSQDTLFSSVRQVPRQPIRYPVSRGNMVAAQAGSLRYIRNLGDGMEELYDPTTDPLEQNDLRQAPAMEPALGRFRQATDSLFPPGP